MNPVRWYIFKTICIVSLSTSKSIVNPNQESADIVIFRKRTDQLGPSSWAAGVKCLDEFAKIFFHGPEHLTRSYNLVFTVTANMSSPAAHIQDGFLKHLNEVVSERAKVANPFQLRVISDAQRNLPKEDHTRALLLADYYVIITDSVTRLKGLLRNYVSRLNSWNPGARFLVLYNNVLKRNMENEVATSIFSEMQEEYYVHNIALLYATTATKYSFLIMDYYNTDPCRTLEIRAMGSCDDGRPVPSSAKLRETLTMYQNRVIFDNCTFYVCASISAPFVERDCVTGLELRLINFIRNRLKFQIQQTCEFESRGVQESSGNWTGLLRRLNDRFCDFILGGFYPDNDVANSFWATDCYLDDSHTWFIKLADPRPPWVALYSIFENQTWLCFGVVLFITWIFWFLFVNLLPEPAGHKELSLTGLNNLGVSISVAVNERPICNATRIFFLALTLYSLNVVSTYTSKLISVLTNPGYLHQIDNLDEVLAAGIPFGGHEESRDWFENDDDYWIFEQYNYSLEFEPNGPNLMAVKRGERVLLTSRMYIKQHNISDELFAFPLNVFSSSLQMIVKPGFPFLFEFNMLIRYMRDTGIFEKLRKDFIYNNTYLNRIAKMRPDFRESAIVLKTEHLQGPFAILIIGTFGSTIVFLIEIFAHWCYDFCLKRGFCQSGSDRKASTKKNTRSKYVKNSNKRQLRKKSWRSKQHIKNVIRVEENIRFENNRKWNSDKKKR